MQSLLVLFHITPAGFSADLGLFCFALLSLQIPNTSFQSLSWVRPGLLQLTIKLKECGDKARRLLSTICLLACLLSSSFSPTSVSMLHAKAYSAIWSYQLCLIKHIHIPPSVFNSSFIQHILILGGCGEVYLLRTIRIWFLQFFFSSSPWFHNPLNFFSEPPMNFMLLNSVTLSCLQYLCHL